MAELERHLRSRKYLRDANVSSDEMAENITVTTWDNWSLMPTVSFGRQGGESTYSFGIKERNLLGLGIDAELETYRNSQRKGYKIKTTIPLFSKQNIDLKLRFADNDDGTQQSLFLQKHFVSFYTDNAYLVGFDEASRNDTIYQNDSELAIFSHDYSYKNIEYAWLSFNHEYELIRFHVGITQDQHKFSYNDKVSNNTNSLLLPQDRDFIYPWLGVDYIEKDFKKLTNIHLITQIEDFNHGWQISSRLGLGDGKKENSAWAFYQANINKGFEIHQNALLLMGITLNGDVYEQQDHRLLLNINTEYFYNFNKNWGFYFNNNNVISKNQYLDHPVTVGGNTGLRGFPLQYQHGEHSIKFTSEIRYYPHINLVKLFDLAGAAFIDSARTFGNTAASGVQENIEKGWLYSLGIGARLYSPHSAGNHQVIHIDFALPQSDNPNIDNFEIRIEAKKSF
jgi:outer membrane protein assembly factor BamA